MNRLIAIISLLVFNTFAQATEIPMFSKTLSETGSFELLSHKIELPTARNNSAFMVLQMKLETGEEKEIRFQMPKEKLSFMPGFVSHSYSLIAEEKNYYLGSVALWDDGIILHPESKVYLPQVRFNEDQTQVEFFVDTEIFEQVRRDLQRSLAFDLLHRETI